MKQLPNKLESLILNLEGNNLGENTENLKGLGEAMPNNLEKLVLGFYNNNLGDNYENFKWIG